MLKTEGIDFSKDFRWFDDYAMEVEKEILKSKNCFNNFIQVDLQINPNQLLNIIDLLKIK